MKVMVTGHRPIKIGGYDRDNPIRSRINEQVRNILRNVNEVIPVTGITGMAIGTDQDFALICKELEIPYFSYVPFEGQESVWPAIAKDEYYDLLGSSEEVVYVNNGNYTPKKMQLRNEAMVNNSDLAIAVWNGDTRGGTYNCISYLKKTKKVPIIYVEA